jgi:HAE1 family hydrophobic/amphiphilic exporter-1
LPKWFAVNNAIVLVDYINQLRKRGMEKTEAIIEAGATRLRPILMSSSTTILALIPLSILKGDGSEIFAPVSITLLGGLLTSTFFNSSYHPGLVQYAGWMGKQIIQEKRTR